MLKQDLGSAVEELTFVMKSNYNRTIYVNTRIDMFWDDNVAKAKTLATCQGKIPLVPNSIPQVGT